jgi:transketolase
VPIVDARTGEVRRRFTPEELEQVAARMRGHALVALCEAGSGHAGGTLSVMDIAAALYLDVADHDPFDPEWPDRDRIIWSAGHKAPALYVALGVSGYFDVEQTATLRKLGSPFQGHPHRLACPGVEASTGSLGQGLSVAVGIALAARLGGKGYTVFCITGDGELQEGQIWEAAMEASHHALNRLILVVDRNRLQIDGHTEEVMRLEPLADKFEAFGWRVLEVDGHRMADLVSTLRRAKEVSDAPTVVIAHTVKGKGVSFMENRAGWHGRAPDREQLDQALRGLRLQGQPWIGRMVEHADRFQREVTKRLDAKTPRFSRDYFWNTETGMKVEMIATKQGFARALERRGDDPRVVCLGADISDSIGISQFHKHHPDRRHRFLSMGIAEQSATGVAAGLAKEGYLPVFGTYGVFSAGRNLDQFRTTVCYGQYNVLVAGAHGGVSVGPDGATHQALEDLFNMCGIPGVRVVVPCDALETERATEHLLFGVVGPKYIRFAREATPVVTTPDTPFAFGTCTIFRYRGRRAFFHEAFDAFLGDRYESEGEDLTLLACGPVVAEAMRAAYILREEHGLETRVVNVHTLKPLDQETVRRAALETSLIITAEEHQVGGLAHRVAGALAATPGACAHGCVTGAIGVKDRFGESGQPWELAREFEVSAEHIAAQALELRARALEEQP